MGNETTTTTKPVGYYTGVLDVYYAIMSGEDTAAAAPTYGTPAVLGQSINVTITPQYREGSRYASNHKVRNVRRVDSYEVSVTADQVVAAVRRALLGRTADTKGVEVITGDQEAPYVAIGFAITKDNGSKELWWLYKGKFSELETNQNTDGESIEYRDVVLSGTFDRRIFDNALAAVADEDADGIDATTLSGWFGAVYES